MSGVARGVVRIVTESADECVLTADLPVSPSRVFRALTSDEVTACWVRSGVFDTREWSGDVRAGGRWEASGDARGRAYLVQGEFLEIDAPRRLVHTWHGINSPAATRVTYVPDAVGAGTRLKLTQSGFASAEICHNHCAGWETSLYCLLELLSGSRPRPDREHKQRTIALSNSAHVFARPEAQARWLAFVREVLGLEPEEVRKPYLKSPKPMYAIRFPNGVSLSIEFENDALLDEQALRSAWFELRSDDAEALQQRALAFGLKKIVHPFTPFFYVQAPGGQVFRIVQEEQR